MTTSSLTRVLQGLRRAALSHDGIGLTDAELLTSFIEQRDEAAFESLLRRHGPMVLGVCRRVLHNEHDAEDAFQATFLVLLGKATSIVPRTMVGNWLYGVAHTTSLRARGALTTRRAKEREMLAMRRSEPSHQDLWDDLQRSLDRELSRLPDKYRVPIVLCDLESKSIKEAARHLGWPQGTVAGRLARARALLARRLARHGATVSGGTLAPLLSQHALACLPVSLTSSTLGAVSLLGAHEAQSAGIISGKVGALTQGVLKGMQTARLRIATAVLFGTSALGLGVGIVAYATQAAEPSGAQIVGESQNDVPRKGAEPTAELPVVERQFKQYQVEILLVKVDAQGRDLGKDGTGKVLSRPTLVVREGTEGTVLSGGQQAVPGANGAVEFIDFGLRVHVKVTGISDGRVRLESVLERTEVEQTGQDAVQTRGQVTRSIARVKLGEAVKLLE
ncbi:MAG TPA: sigma-70 family RNA polymerase sigma factor, partial [Gemmataceae bacterium]|nr:sigma-70 family RNA polymerase sigma factor [Gemmataceae bacterium]